MEGSRCVDLKDEHIRCFQEKGFFNIGCMTTDQELVWLTEVYDRIVKQEIGYTPDALAKGPSRHDSAGLITIFFPERVVPALTRTLFFYNACKVVARLLGVEATHLAGEWRLVCKPAHGGKTSWHQDAMYHVDDLYRPLPHRGASVWMPLDPATIESGCLQYIPGSHCGDIRPHYVRNDCMRTDDVALTQAVSYPVAVGEATFHHCRTLHGAGPNTTDGPRRALQVIFQVTENSQNE